MEGRIGGNRDKFFKNVEYFLQRRKELGLNAPIIDVKIIEMPENQHEVEKVMSYWQSRGAWTAKRRQYSWAGNNTNIRMKNKDFRIVCGRTLGIAAITWEGKLLICPNDADATIVLGDLNVESLKDIWARRNEQIVKYHFSHEWDKLPKICQSCNDWQIVGEERFDENGNPINKNYKEKGKVFSDKS